VALHGALHAGATAILHDKRFDPGHALDLLVNRPCSVFMAVPTIHRRLVDAPAAETGGLSLRHMRLITSGSDRLPDELFAQFRGDVSACVCWNVTACRRQGMMISNPLHGERRVGSVGLPLPGVAVRIVDPEDEALLPDGAVGEVQVRGANVCKGYWRQPEKSAAAFTPDGWFRTGDLGLREAGRLLHAQGALEGPDHQRRLQCLSAGSGVGVGRTPSRCRQRRDRLPGC
jgi:acyl-CoA synthetase (AMP-forming)/AMP-acid ligase II